MELDSNVYQHLTFGRERLKETISKMDKLYESFAKIGTGAISIEQLAEIYEDTSTEILRELEDFRATLDVQIRACFKDCKTTPKTIQLK